MGNHVNLQEWIHQWKTMTGTIGGIGESPRFCQTGWMRPKQPAVMASRAVSSEGEAGE